MALRGPLRRRSAEHGRGAEGRRAGRRCRLPEQRRDPEPGPAPLPGARRPPPQPQPARSRKRGRGARQVSHGRSRGAAGAGRTRWAPRPRGGVGQGPGAERRRRPRSQPERARVRAEPQAAGTGHESARRARAAPVASSAGSGDVRGGGDRPRRRRRSRQGAGVSALPRSLPCMLLTAGWPGAGDPTGPGVPLPLPPPEPPPPLGLEAAIVGSEEPSGAAAAAMQQAQPLARPRGAASAGPGPAPGTPPPERDAGPHQKPSLERLRSPVRTHRRSGWQKLGTRAAGHKGGLQDQTSVCALGATNGTQLAQKFKNPPVGSQTQNQNGKAERDSWRGVSCPTGDADLPPRSWCCLRLGPKFLLGPTSHPSPYTARGTPKTTASPHYSIRIYSLIISPDTMHVYQDLVVQPPPTQTLAALRLHSILEICPQSKEPSLLAPNPALAINLIAQVLTVARDRAQGK